MYDFDNDIATIYTGETDMRMSGLIDTYRRLPKLPHWHGEHCSRVRGASDATKFPSLIQPNDTIYFYRKSVCRAMPTVRVILISSVCSGTVSICCTFILLLLVWFLSHLCTTFTITHLKQNIILGHILVQVLFNHNYSTYNVISHNNHLYPLLLLLLLLTHL